MPPESPARPSPFADAVGVEILEISPTRARGALTIEARHCNALGVCHGGALFTLADRVFGVANAQGEGRWIGMEVHIRYLRPALEGQRITAEAGLLHRGRATSVFEVRLHDERGRLIAVADAAGHVMAERKD